MMDESTIKQAGPGKVIVFHNESDPWKHRGDSMRCKSCMWFVPKVVSEERKAELGYQPGPLKLFDIGRCRRHAPSMGGYPVVYVNDWCGDHRIDENKL